MGDAPAEIIQLLLESYYQSLYPGYVFNWTMVVETIGRCDTPKERIENLLRVRQIHFPEQPIDWVYLLDEFVKPSIFQLIFAERILLLFICGMLEPVEALPFKVWRTYITAMIQTANFKSDENNSGMLRSIREKLVHFKDELPKLKEATSYSSLHCGK